MSFACTAVRVLIASPSDVHEERAIAKRTVENWNTLRSAATNVAFLPVLWELHTIPEQGDRPQAIVNKQIVAQADVLVAVFWTRLGTPTGVAESGTAEEIRELKAAGKHVAIYFSKRPIDPYSPNEGEFARLKAFREWCTSEGLIDEFVDHATFTAKLMHLLDTLAGRFRPSGGAEAPAEAVASRDTALLEDLKRYMARATAMWQVEKDSETHKLDDAKRIIRGIADNILRVATSLNDQRMLDLEVAKALAKEARTLERHELYMDGGRSYNAFWELGDSIIKRISELL